MGEIRQPLFLLLSFMFVWFIRGLLFPSPPSSSSSPSSSSLSRNALSSPERGASTSPKNMNAGLEELNTDQDEEIALSGRVPETCARKDTRFLNNGYKRPRVGFVSFPRSGNSMTRILIERVTGIWTGSTIVDNMLQEVGFLGEGYTDDTVSVIKDHARFIQRFERQKYDKVLYLYRNPFDVFLSNMNREMAEGRHNVTMAFDPALFHQKVTERWIQQWKRHVTTFVRNRTNHMYFSKSRNRYLPVLLLRYEDFAGKDCSSMVEQLSRLAKFLELPQDAKPLSIETILARSLPPQPSWANGTHYPRSAEDFITISPAIHQERVACICQPEKAGYTPRKKEKKYGVDAYSVELRDHVIKELKEDLCFLGLTVLSPTLTIECDPKQPKAISTPD